MKKNPENQIPISIQLDQDIQEKIILLAMSHKVSLSDYIQQVLQQHLTDLTSASSQNSSVSPPSSACSNATNDSSPAESSPTATEYTLLDAVDMIYQQQKWTILTDTQWKLLYNALTNMKFQLTNEDRQKVKKFISSLENIHYSAASNRKHRKH